jgi:peptidoglycan/xylan/chitin deacetylase (PgdA/CDA1 family)
MLARIFNNNYTWLPNDFGFLVTKENVEDYLTDSPKTPVQSISKVNNDLPILMYHEIQKNLIEEASTIISYKKFKEDMLWLKNNGYNTVFFKDVINYIKGKEALPDKPILITFDDGYLSNYEYAYPLLKELNMKATIFIIGWSVDSNTHKYNITPFYPHFNWKQAKEMYDSGYIDIQSHTFDLHKKIIEEENGRKGLSQIQDESYHDYVNLLKNDSNTMQNLFDKYLGCKIYALSYPYGEYSFNTPKAMKQLGIKATVTTEYGTNNIYVGMYNLFNLKRINMTEKIPISTAVEPGKPRW